MPGTAAYSSFKSEHDLTKRREVASKIREKYPDRIPVIVERDPRPNSSAPPIDKKKFLVPADLTVNKFVFEIRKHMELTPDKAIFVFVNDTMPPTSDLMQAVYEKNRDEDGFLYVTYSGESTFGQE